MKTPLGTEVDIGAGHIVLGGFPALRERGTAPPSIVAMVAHLSYCSALAQDGGRHHLEFSKFRFLNDQQG